MGRWIVRKLNNWKEVTGEAEGGEVEVSRGNVVNWRGEKLMKGRGNRVVKE